MKKLEKLVERLYQVDCFIEREELQELLEYGDDLIPYLEGIIKDCINNYKKYLEKYKNAKENEYIEWFFIIHAFFMLGELEREKSLDIILEFLSKDEEFLDFYLSDMLCEDIWEVVYKTGKRSPEKLIEFLVNSNNYTYARLSASKAIVKIFKDLENDNGNQKRIINTYKELIETDKDSEFIAFLICDIADFKTRELDEEVVKSFKENKVDLSIIDLNDYEMSKYKGYTDIQLKNIFDKYEEFKKYYFSSISPHNPDYEKIKKEKELKKVSNKNVMQRFEEKAVNKALNGFEVEIRTEKKIGRNEPCSCGSGKKYKKCCGR